MVCAKMTFSHRLAMELTESPAGARASLAHVRESRRQRLTHDSFTAVGQREMD